MNEERRKVVEEKLLRPEVDKLMVQSILPPLGTPYEVGWIDPPINSIPAGRIRLVSSRVLPKSLCGRLLEFLRIRKPTWQIQHEFEVFTVVSHSPKERRVDNGY